MPPERPQEQPEPEEKAPTRREFIKEILGGATLGAIAQEEAQAARRRRARPPRQQAPQENIEGPIYSTGKLEGRNLADLYAIYTGISGRVPPKARIDFRRQLKLMWDRKERVSRKNRVVIKTSAEIQKLYNIEGRRNLANFTAFLNGINEVVEDTKESIDWDRLKIVDWDLFRNNRLDSRRLDILKDISTKIQGTDLVAYSLTELMPSRDGTLNIDVLSFLLLNAGPGYIYSIPAMYDPKTSFGPYQFTEYALYSVPDGRGGGRRGASVVNQALPIHKQIPGSVSMLRGNQHHRAAYLFMISNFSNLVRTASMEDLRHLGRISNREKKELVIFAATAHHMPGPAIEAALRWLANDTRTTYTVSCGPHLRKYALKTEANLKALDKID